MEEKDDKEVVKIGGVGREFGGNDQCLFCFGNAIEMKDEDTVLFLPGSQGKELVDRQLWAFFVLRDLLNFPREETTKMLQSSGGTGLSEWFALCENCKGTVNRAMEVYMELLKLTEKLKGFKQEVKKIVTRSLGLEMKQDKGMTPFSKEIRDYFIETNDLLNNKHSSPVPQSNEEIYATSSSSHEDWSGDDRNDEEDLNDASNSDLEWTPKTKRLKPQEIKVAADIYSTDSEEDEDTTDKLDDTSNNNSKKDSNSKPLQKRQPKKGTKAPKQEPPEGPPFICKLCKSHRIFPSAIAMMRHNREHRSHKHPCPNCNYPLKTESRLNKHLEKNMCDPNNLIKCEECDFYTESVAHIKAHKLFTCPAVQKGTISRAPRRKKNTGGGPFICDICGAKRKDQKTLDGHVKMHEYYENCEVVDGKVKCKVCGDLTLGKLDLRRHVRAKHASELGLAIFQCALCPLNFPVEHHLDRHVALVHTNPEQFRFQCELCGYGTNVSTSLKRHMLKHQKERPFRCDQCDATFKLLSTCKEHTERAHKSTENGDNKVTCQHCGVRVVNASFLKLHMRDAHKELLKHKCDLCEKEYLSRVGLWAHKKASHGEGTGVKCQFCGATSRCYAYLKRHLEKNCKMKPAGYTG